ncbi:phage baseplate protein [Campylobacter mucosalis]|uniref:phage baseplate protein n=1 Tax=Campylobacter mucosalis TaxID=202 RepID=UPI0014704B11|nr:hypothetical protein [Campylobacter mucosalis]
MTNLISRRIGKITLDVTEQEAHKSVLRLTKNPVESGANVSDHAILEPKQITIKGKIVAYEPPEITKFDEVMDLVRPNLAYIKPAFRLTQKALKLKAQVEHTQAVINKYSKVLFDTEFDVLGEAGRVIAPFLPDFVKQKDDNTKTGDRLSEALNSLYQAQRSADTLEVQTGLRLYKNMKITSIEATTEQDLYADVTLNLEEIFIVETKMQGGLNVANKGKARDFGKTQPSAKKSSLLKDIF